MYRILRALIAPLAALIFLGSTIAPALLTMAFQAPPPLRGRLIGV